MAIVLKANGTINPAIEKRLEVMQRFAGGKYNSPPDFGNGPRSAIDQCSHPKHAPLSPKQIIDQVVSWTFNLV